MDNLKDKTKKALVQFEETLVSSFCKGNIKEGMEMVVGSSTTEESIEKVARDIVALSQPHISQINDLLQCVSVMMQNLQNVIQEH